MKTILRSPVRARLSDFDDRAESKAESGRIILRLPPRIERSFSPHLGSSRIFETDAPPGPFEAGVDLTHSLTDELSD
jgi:hypothetical protein